jgi:hypothetical protein
MKESLVLIIPDFKELFPDFPEETSGRQPQELYWTMDS